MWRTPLLWIHVAVALTGWVISFVFRKPPGPSPSILPALLNVLLTGQACLLGVWFAFSDRRLWIRLIGFSVGLSAIVFANVSVESSGLAIRDRLGLVIEFLGIPAIGVAVVLFTLRSCAFHLAIADQNAQGSSPRISLSGLLTVVTAVAVLLAMRSAIQFLAGFDRISVSILTQTVALSSLSLAATWATLSGRRTKVRVVAYVLFAAAVSFFVGYYWAASFQFVFGLVPALTVFLAAIIIVVTLAFLRRSGIRIVVRDQRSVRLVLRVATSTLLIAGVLFGIDLFYAKYWSGNSAHASKSDPLISDTTGALRLKAIERFQDSPSVEGLVHLLRLNGDTTVIDTLRGMTYHNRIPVVFVDMAYAASFFCAICSIILVTVLLMLSSSFGVRSCFLLVGMGCSV